MLSLTPIQDSPKNEICSDFCNEINSEIYLQTDLFQSAFPCMEEIRRQGKLCDVVLKVISTFFNI